MEQMSKSWNWYFGFWHATVPGYVIETRLGKSIPRSSFSNFQSCFLWNKIGNLKKKIFPLPIGTYWEKRVISTIHEQFWISFGKACCHNDSWGIFEKVRCHIDSWGMFWIWNAADLRPRKIEKTWPNNSLVKNNFKICRFENGPFGKRRKFKSSISRNAPYSPY